MAARTFTLTVIISDGTASRTSYITQDVDKLEFIETTVAASTTNLQHALAFDYTKLKQYFLLAEGNSATLKFNSTGSPAPSVALADGLARAWDSQTGETSLFAANVTTLYVSTPSGDPCDLTLWFVVDPT